MTTKPKLSIYTKAALLTLGAFGFSSLFIGVVSMFVWLYFGNYTHNDSWLPYRCFLFSEGILSVSYGSFGHFWLEEKFFEVQTTLPKPSIKCLVGFHFDAYEGGGYIYIPLIGPACASLLAFCLLILKVVMARRKAFFAAPTTDHELS